MTTKKFLKAAQHIVRWERLKAQADAEFEKAKELLGGSVSYANSENGPLCLEIPLGDYLTLYPDTRPELKTFERNGATGQITRGYLDYPPQLIDTPEQIWIAARTPAFDVPTPAAQTDEK